MKTLIGVRFDAPSRQYVVTVVKVRRDGSYRASPLSQPYYGNGRRMAVEGSYFGTRAEAEIIADEVERSWTEAEYVPGELVDYLATLPGRCEEAI